MNGDAAVRKSPDFKNPPLNEVVCGVQFAPIQGWLTCHYGLFWDRVKPEYPGCEDHPSLPRITLGEFETPDELALRILPPLPRVFLLTKPENYLIQLQPDRFLHNWRKFKATDDYPRFPDAYSRFSTQWTEFKSFLEDARLPAPRVDAYELTYVNTITAPEVRFPRDVWRFMNFYKALPQTASGADPRGLSLTVGWPLEGDAGRLGMSLRHGVRAGEPQGAAEEIMVVEFTARGASEKDGANMDQWFKAAHDAIVYTFASLTTEEGHQLWGRIA